MSARFIGHTNTHRTSRLGIPWKTPSGRDLKKLEFSRLEKKGILLNSVSKPSDTSLRANPLRKLME